MKNEFQIPLSKKKMKHMFADYLRNKLNPEEKSLFESSLSYYPEIQSDRMEPDLLAAPLYNCTSMAGLVPCLGVES
jgi:hypothetical protein